MTETEARQVLLLQAHEQALQPGPGLGPGAVPRPPSSAPPSPHWSADDRSWATRQAIAAVGDHSTPQTFVVARAAAGLQRLLPRDAAARRWLERRAWHGAWVWLAALVGLVAGLLADQLGPPQHVNLLAPAVWAVVAWNLLVYASAVLPWPGDWSGGLQRALVRWGQRGNDPGARLLWARHAAPLSLARAALVLHVAAAMLAVGLIAGLYLRGLVLDYRAGWQSTFLTTAQVQAMLGTLLAPASALTGIVLPDVAALRVGPGAPATATAAPWIHLYATTLLLWVVLPRTLLALWAALRAGRQARHFPLPLDTPYFESLHPLMRPGQSRTVRLLWAAPPTLGAVTLLGQRITADLPPLQPVTLLRTVDGETLQLVPAPPLAALQRHTTLAPASSVSWWWQRRPAEDPAAPSLATLRAQTDAVLWVSVPQAPVPGWLAALQRPVLVLHDAAVAEPPALPLRSLAAGWLADGRWLQALQAALPEDTRIPRLAAVWTAQQAGGFDAAVAAIAASLGRVAASRVALADDGLLARRGNAETAQQALLAQLQAEWQASAAGGTDANWSGGDGRGASGSGADGSAPPAGSGAQAGAHAGGPPSAEGITHVGANAGANPGANPGANNRRSPGGMAVELHGMANTGQPAGAEHTLLPTAAALRNRVGEGPAALVGGVTTGALAGLKADIVSGGLTMGAGMVIGALVGAATAAGLARGVNVVRGTDRSFAAWDAPALALLTEAWLLRQLAPGHPPEAARAALQAALAAHKEAWAAVWKARSQRFDNAGEAQRLAEALRLPLAAVLRDALARLHPGQPVQAPAAAPAAAP